MNKRRISFVYRLLVIASLASGIFLNLYHTKSIVSILSYYTLQVNIICLITFIILEIADIANKKYRDHELYYTIKGALIIAVLLMAATYLVALAPIGFEMEKLQSSIQRKWLANLLVHELSPLLVIGDYILFDDKGNFKLFYPIIWLILPLNYAFYVYAYSAAGGEFYGLGGSREFAYFFLDYKEIGYEGVLKWMLFMCIIILTIGYMIVYFDNRLAKRKTKEKN